MQVPLHCLSAQLRLTDPWCTASATSRWTGTTCFYMSLTVCCVLACVRTQLTPALVYFTSVLQGHMGPVYALQWSPFRRDMFVSAAGDWTLRLWQEGRQSALLQFQSGSHEVGGRLWVVHNSAWRAYHILQVAQLSLHQTCTHQWPCK
jgi:hypothetical protein